MPTIADLGPVQTIATARLTPYPANARRISAKAVDQTAESLLTFGWQQPIVTDPALVIVVGHVRHRAARQIGLAECPVIVAEHLTPDQIRAYRIADNRTHDYTAWDYSLLARELDGLDDDFARVLGLADWRAIVDQFTEDGQAAAADLALGQEAGALVSAEHAMTVIFATQAERDQAGPAVLKLPGVLDVRYAR